MIRKAIIVVLDGWPTLFQGGVSIDLTTAYSVFIGQTKKSTTHV